MRLALISEINIKHKSAWSGTIHYIGESLRSAGAEVEVLDPIWEWQTQALNTIGKILRRFGANDPMFNRNRTVSRMKAKALLKRLEGGASFDALLAPVGSTLISDVPPGIPIVYISDATVPLMQDYYGKFGQSTAMSSARAIDSEKAALRRADFTIYPTWWAAESAINDLGVDPERILVQPFGANLSDPPSRDDALRSRREGPLKLLFCGVEWERKGGDVALAAVSKLLADGQDVVLTILGCVPPEGALSDPDLARAVTVVPFLNKTIPAERAQFREIFLDADIFILPTVAECYGLVFCEAAACGAVSFGTATGGVPEVIRDGETGRVLAPGSTGEDYANAIMEVLEVPDRLETMRQAARLDFETRLNWQVWGDAVLEHILAIQNTQQGNWSRTTP